MEASQEARELGLRLVSVNAYENVALAFSPKFFWVDLLILKDCPAVLHGNIPLDRTKSAHT